MPYPLIKRAFLDIPEGQVHYRFAFPVSPPEVLKAPIIFLHKSASSSASWVHLMTYYVNKGHKCFAPDMPGFGCSFEPAPNPATPYTSEWFCDMIRTALSQLGLFDPKNGGFHIVGHHSGVTLGTQFSISFPEVVKSVSFIGTAYSTQEQIESFKGFLFNAYNTPVEDGSHLIKTWEYIRKWGCASDLELCQREALDHIRAWNGRNIIYAAAHEQSKKHLYLKVPCPILIMCSSGDVLWQFWESTKAVRPDATAVEIGGEIFGPDKDWENIAKHVDTHLARQGE